MKKLQLTINGAIPNITNLSKEEGIYSTIIELQLIVNKQDSLGKLVHFCLKKIPNITTLNIQYVKKIYFWKINKLQILIIIFVWFRCKVTNQSTQDIGKLIKELKKLKKLEIYDSSVNKTTSETVMRKRIKQVLSNHNMEKLIIKNYISIKQDTKFTLNLN